MKKQTEKDTARTPVSVEKALGHRSDDLVVKEKGEVTIGPDDEYEQHFHRVHVASFKDLQRMSLVPEGLDEKKAMEAITRDNDAAFEAAVRAPADDDHDCDCEQEGAAPRPARSRDVSPLRARYSRMRRTFNPHLARVLSEVYGREVQWDNAIAVHAYRWTDRLVASKGFDLGAFVLRDIVVAKNSTLNIAASTQIVLAKDIRIHTGGKIRTLGSYMKLKCASIEGNLA